LKGNFNEDKESFKIWIFIPGGLAKMPPQSKIGLILSGKEEGI
jgi:hypothetical protein